MSIFEKSPLEFICWPLKLFGTDDVRQTYVYEHVFTPVVAMAYFYFLPFKIKFCLFWIVLAWHLLWKELIYDPMFAKKDFNIKNVYERIYGIALSSIFLL